MSIIHVKSNTIPSWTGTVTVGNSTGGTQTAAATDLVLPSDWNSAHNQFYTLTGNTNGASTASGTNVVLSGGNNVTLVGGGATVGFSVGNYITTGALSDHSHGNPTLALTNLSGTTASNSAGLTLSLSAAAPGGAGTIAGWEPFQVGNNSTFSSQGQNSLYLQKVRPDVNFSFNNIEFRFSGSFVSSSNSQVGVHTIRYGLYSLETNESYNSIATSSIIISASFNSNTAMGYTISQGAGSYTTTSGGTVIASLMTGLKHLYLPFTNTLTAGGEYAVGLLVSSATTVNTGAHRMAFLNQTVINNLTVGKVYATTMIASNSTHVGDYAQGVYNTTTGAMPAAVAKSQMTNAVSQALLYHQFEV